MKRLSWPARIFTKIAFLWYNVIGAVVVVIFGVLISKLNRRNEVAVP